MRHVPRLEASIKHIIAPPAQVEDRFSVRTRWALVMVFAIAMACVEAASVFYIRALVDRIEPYQANPLPLQEALGSVELWREAATLVMIATLGMLAGRTWRCVGALSEGPITGPSVNPTLCRGGPCALSGWLRVCRDGRGR